MNTEHSRATAPSMLQSEERDTTLRVGIGSSPWLADHGFRDMVVLPGSHCVDAAVSLHREVLQECPAALHSVSFDRPVILSDQDTVLTVKSRHDGMQGLHLSFYESGSAQAELQPFASITTAAARAAPGTRRTAVIRVEEFQTRAHSVLPAHEFYERLRTNGNQYGPHFQRVARVWLAEDQALAELRLPQAEADSARHTAHASVVDCMAQVLSSLALQRGRTFILRSIDTIEMAGITFPETLWAHATVTAGAKDDDSGIAGEIVVFDDSGKVHLVAHGVSLVFLGSDESRADAGLSLRVASTFTAEPVEDSLRFWSAFLELPVSIQFAPYNQVFQQLLDQDSLFARNRDGANVILMSLDGWSTPEEPDEADVPGERRDALFAGRQRYMLPNNLEIVHVNKYETDYLYKEIFEDRVYLRHGISLEDGDTVLDIGANIGLFSLFVTQSLRNTRVFAYEPAPAVYELLKANTEAHGRHVRVYNLGVSDHAALAPFTFYRKSTVFSGFYSDAHADRKAIQAVVRNMIQGQAGVEAASLGEYVEALTEDRLDSETRDVQMTSVSDIIGEHRLDTIDLLKIDAEKSELDILRGIGDDDWPRIKQIVIEVHDESRMRVKQVETTLTNRGFTCTVEQDPLLDQSGLYNIYGRRPRTRTHPPEHDRRSQVAAAAMRRNIDEFSSALAPFMARSRVPLILAVCPASPASTSDQEMRDTFDECEKALVNSVRQIAGVVPIDSQTLLRRYEIDRCFDPEGHRLGHIPYTAQFFASIGSSLFRALFNMRKQPFKVIALDCDNTLWKGVCGEDGPLGVQVTPPHRALQEFMVEQANAGMLMCLCTKNNERDVLDVFERRHDLPLTLEHLACWRMNWAGKSTNLISLAKELNVGLDSFIFVDDNPLECAEVRTRCPEVLTLQLPADPAGIPVFLRNIWAFDHSGPTLEDANRTRMYRANIRREAFQRQSISLKSFLDGLQLNVDTSFATEDQISRISQLTFRTNQFNATTIRRTESEIRQLIAGQTHRCLVTRVSDRFGDYGLVGILIFEDHADRYVVDSFLLSCRVLGRGVEHRMLSHLGRKAIHDGRSVVEISYVPTSRNSPALEFIEGIAAQYRTIESGQTIYRVPAETIAHLEYAPPLDPALGNAHSGEAPAQRAVVPPSGGPGRSEKMQQIGEEFHDLTSILGAMDRLLVDRKEPNRESIPGPENELQGKLIDIWQKVLRKPRIGINDNFIDSGGSSLKAVQIISSIRRELAVQLSIVTLFECPTIASLAAKISALGTQTPVKADDTPAFRRGARRKVAQRQRGSGT